MTPAKAAGKTIDKIINKFCDDLLVSISGSDTCFSLRAISSAFVHSFERIFLFISTLCAAYVATPVPAKNPTIKIRVARFQSVFH